MSASDMGLSSVVFGDSIFDGFFSMFALVFGELEILYSFFVANPLFLLFVLIPVVGLGIGLFRRLLDL